MEELKGDKDDGNDHIFIQSFESSMALSSSFVKRTEEDVRSLGIPMDTLVTEESERSDLDGLNPL